VQEADNRAHKSGCEPKVVEEIIIGGDGVNQSRWERVRVWIGVGSAQAVLQRKKAPDVFREAEEAGTVAISMPDG
jgi:hypothetical protein